MSAGAANFATINAFYEGIFTDAQYQLSMLEPFIFAIIPMIMVGIYCLFGWRLMPKDEGHLSVGDETFTQTHYTKTQEYIIYACMIGVTVVMIFRPRRLPLPGSRRRDRHPHLTGVLDAQEASRLMLCDTIWMMAGVLVVSDALGTSGVSELVGNLLLSVLGKDSNPSSSTSSSPRRRSSSPTSCPTPPRRPCSSPWAPPSPWPLVGIRAVSS